ncbi:MAG TPA: c-type cytochrome [Niabella sp.]|nr:c-type cytochrome [Niabella sp.]HQW14185.1 c-type cytochrome [Niabella sp.]HQX19585.1 c-type cytochrome [Niabella sp.]HQX39981.1 c-type cytochrome [Niabella sp.]HRB06975.1 c-type cytochrome [Niabella sp.]
MNKKVITVLGLVMAIFFVACGGGESADQKATEGSSSETSATEAPAAEAPASTEAYDPKRGEGKFDETNVDVSKFDAAMATKGKAIAETKCFSCHKMTDERLVGPGWKGVTSKHNAHWIMNFITNPDPMIDKDPEVQSQLELCLVRMPNQNLAENEAREILEFMRGNDGAK